MSSDNESIQTTLISFSTFVSYLKNCLQMKTHVNNASQMKAVFLVWINIITLQVDYIPCNRVYPVTDGGLIFNNTKI